MPVKSKHIIYGLMLVHVLPVMAEELPSLDFLEYLGSEESRVDNEWSSPVDLDIEQYLATNQPNIKKSDVMPSVNSQDKAHD